MKSIIDSNFNLFFIKYIMKYLKKLDNIIKVGEKKIANHLTSVNVSCHRIIFFDSLLWLLFIIYYIGHYFYTKEFTKFEKKHKKYENLLNEKDMIIFTVISLAIILYIHFFILYKN